MAATITRKTVTAEGWRLATPSDMLTALTELKSQGWSGAVEYDLDKDAWTLRLSCSGKQTVNATLGQSLINDNGLRAGEPESFSTDYEVDNTVVLPPKEEGAETFSLKVEETEEPAVAPPKESIARISRLEQRG